MGLMPDPEEVAQYVTRLLIAGITALRYQQRMPIATASCLFPAAVLWSRLMAPRETGLLPFAHMDGTDTLIAILAALQAGLIILLLGQKARGKKLAAQLDEHLRFERLISELSASFVEIPAENVDRQVTATLEKVRIALDLDRCILFDYSREQCLLNITHHVESLGTRPLDSPLEPELLPWFFRQMQQGKSVALNDAQRDLPPEADEERVYCRKFEILSVLVIPIRISGELLQGIACHTTRRLRVWSGDFTDRIQSLGKTLHASLAGMRAEAKLKKSEERYRELVESQTELVCRYLPDTTLTFVNEAYCRFFGSSRDQLIGKRFINLIPEDDHEATMRHVDAVAKSDQPVIIEHRATRSDGGHVWQQWVDRPIKNDDGVITEFQAIGRDITDRKAAEALLLEREERISVAAEAANLAVWAFDLVKPESWMTEQGRRLYGLGQDEEISRSALLLRVHPDDRERVKDDVERALADGSDFEIEHRLLGEGGEVRWLVVRGRCLRDGKGRLTELLGVSMDVTDQELADLEMDRQRDAMARLTRVAVMGELAASLAHELNQPLTAISTNAAAGRRMAGKNGTDSFEELFADIAAGAKRAGDVIRSMRSMVNKGQSTRGMVDMNAAIAEVLRLMHSDLLGHETSVITDLAGGLPTVGADPVQMQQVLLNLIMNSLEAMSDQPPSARRLVVRTVKEPEEVAIEIRDFGGGLPKDEPEKVFEQFFTTKSEGMGLGLAIVRSIIEAHAGSLHAENAEGGGALFRFCLPIAAPVQPSANL